MLNLPQNPKWDIARVSHSTLVNADCFDVFPFIEDKSIDAIICDLPYGTTNCKWDSILPFDLLWSEYKRIIKPNGAIVLFGSEPFSSIMRISNLKNYKYDWIWNKKNSGSGLLAKKQPLKICEIVSVFSFGTHNYYPQMIEGKMRNKKSYGSKIGSVTGEIKAGNDKFNNSYFPKNIIEFSNANQNGKEHPTEKPIELLEYLVKTYTNENDMVLDNTMGSGTTSLACLKLNRKSIGIEKEKQYYDVAVRRLSSYCG
jgi:site-specific DNA-methyltransferase (adenine-specific)